jgi:hypothetical protein
MQGSRLEAPTFRVGGGPSWPHLSGLVPTSLSMLDCLYCMKLKVLCDITDHERAYEVGIEGLAD